MIPVIFILLLSLIGTLGAGLGEDGICPVTKEQGIKYFDIRLPKTTVPNVSTYYVCQQYKVPDDDIYHAVAFEALIDNIDIMHHMLLFSCSDDSKPTEPHQCGGPERKCQSWLAVWTVGLKGQICMHKNTGVRFGKGSTKYMSLQIHWNNAALHDNYKDNSGIRIYYTKKLRKYDVGNVQFGQEDLEIPPHTSFHKHSGGCSPRCTKYLLPEPIYLTRTYLHMHNLAVRGLLEQYRRGRIVNQIAYDRQYDYKSPPIHTHNPPIRILPGDDVRLTCWFDTKEGTRSRNITTYWGLGSGAEMCYAFVTYYPRLSYFNKCVQYDVYDTGVCVNYTGKLGSCDVREWVGSLDETFDNIIERCQNKTIPLICMQDCQRPLQTFFSHQCMQGRVGVSMKRTQLPNNEKWKIIKKIFWESACTLVQW